MLQPIDGAKYAGIEQLHGSNRMRVIAMMTSAGIQMDPGSPVSGREVIFVEREHARMAEAQDQTLQVPRAVSVSRLRNRHGVLSRSRWPYIAPPTELIANGIRNGEPVFPERAYRYANST
jgi:hypothetical protein